MIKISVAIANHTRLMTCARSMSYDHHDVNTIIKKQTEESQVKSTESFRRQHQRIFNEFMVPCFLKIFLYENGGS